jgi:hypothetical protein
MPSAAMQTKGTSSGIFDARIVIKKNDICDLTSNISSPLTHRKTDMRRFQGGRIVDAISRYGDYMSEIAERSYKTKFLFRIHSSKDSSPSGMQNISELTIGHRSDLVAGNWSTLNAVKSDHLPDCTSCCAVVTCDHTNRYSCGATLCDGGGDFGSDWVKKGYKTKKD